MKSERGMTYKILVIIIIVMVIAFFMISCITRRIIADKKLDSVITDMLLIQGKSKLVSDEIILKKEGVTLLGKNISESIAEDDIKQIIDRGVISETEENFNGYYILSSEDLVAMELDTVQLDDENSIIVNYANGEVIYTEGFVYNNNLYYRLSELQKLANK
ncbi:MAG: hypothetical protein Q4G05_00395 [Clostridia bacterium]|nr:hypothetical protein [Clostridia bacterium]